MLYLQKTKNAVVIILVLLLAMPLGFAATYYVSNSGSDSNDGLSDTSPWQTIAKVNSKMATLQPGDSILFKKGNSWTGTTINIGASGTSSNYITMGGYGSGAKPIIDGGSGKSAIMISSDRGYWMIDGLDLRTSGISSGGMGMALAIQLNYWPDNELGALHGWIVQNCNFNTGILLSGPDTIIRNNVFEGSAQQTYNIAAIYLRGTRGDNVLIEGNTISNYRGHGMWIMRGCDNVVIRNNVIHNITLGTETNPAGPGHGIANDGYGIKNTNMKIYNNHVGNTVQIGINGENAFGAEYYNNYIHNCGWYGFDIYLYQNGDIQGGSPTDHRGENTGDNFHHNVVVNCQHGFLAYDAAGYTIANNVFYNNGLMGTYTFEITGTSSSYAKNATFVNNIIQGTWTHIFRTSGTYKTMFTKLDYNLIVPLAGGEILYDGYDGARTIAQLQAIGLMTHGLTSSPLFVNPSSENFRLQEGSPGIDAGIATGETLDMDGNPIVGQPDIGAYEFQGGGAPPATGDLVVNAGTGGTATGSESGFIVPDTLSISANPGSGYSFSTWTKTSGDCTITSASSPSTTVVVNSGTCILQATFNLIPTGTLTVNAGTGGSATGSATGFNVPSTRSISATANSGYTFSSWTKTSGDCIVTNPASASTTATINTGTCTLQATFSQIPTGTLTVNAGTGGSATGSTSGFALPSTKTISATANSGYAFSSWTKTSGDCTITSTSSPSTTVVINSGTCTVQANFNQITGSLTVNAGSGGTAIGSATGFALPATRSISATPSSGYLFNNWSKSGDCVVTAPTTAATTATINTGTCIVQANFVLIETGDITVSAGSGGTATGSATGFNVPASRSISASPSYGFVFDEWIKASGDCTIASTSSASTTVVVNSGTCVVQARFDPIPQGSLTVTNTTGGTATGSAANFFLPANRTVDALPWAGYFLNNWTRTSGDCIIYNPSEVTAIVQLNSGDCSVQAYFNAETKTGNLTATSTAGGTASGSSSNFDLPAVKELTASTNTGYRFVSWIMLSGDCTAENPTALQTNIMINNGWCYAEATFAPLASPLAEVYVASTDSTINSDLSCVYQVSGQNNVPTSVKVNWRKNGAIVFSDYASILPKSNLNVGDVWSCQVNASDIYSATIQNSNEITIGTTIIEKTQPPEQHSGGGKDTYIYYTYINYTNVTQISPEKEAQEQLAGNSQETQNLDLPGEENFAAAQNETANTSQSEYANSNAQTKNKGNFWPILLTSIGVLAIGTLSAIALRKPIKSDWRLLQFIEMSLKGGFRRESIYRVLRTKKYPARVIQYHMKLTRDETLHVLPQSPDTKEYSQELTEELTKYVAVQRAHTFTDDEIKEVLANRGYSNKLISEVTKTQA